MTRTRTYPSALPATYTTVRNAVVRLVDLDLAGGAIAFEVSVLRSAHKPTRRPTYQGTVEKIEGGWVAIAISHDRTGEHLDRIGVRADFVDAVTLLVRHKSGHASMTTWTGPRPVCTSPTCERCAELLRRRSA